MEINPEVTFKHDRSLMYAKRPKVLIVGAGLGGLTLGAILQKSDTPYEIFERTPEIMPLGSITNLTGVCAPLLKQLGIWDEFCSLSRKMTTMQIITAPEMETQFVIADVNDPVKRYGAESRALPRPTLYDLLMRQVPKERLHLGKKVLSTQQGGNGVLIRCSDGTEYEGDILVGSDGAYSAVRQNLYAQLKKENKLPASDSLPMPFLNVCLVGQTRELTVEEFPDLAKSEVQFKNVLSRDKPYSWMTFTTQENTVCFSVFQYLNEESSKENDAFKNSEWGLGAAMAMCAEVGHFPISSGGDRQLTLADLFAWTPKENMSKVMLEEKIFKTWYHTRTVLMGDSCHKLNPAGGSGAVNALHDAVVLANYIHALPDHPIAEEIMDAFKAYRKERLPHVQAAFNTSAAFRSMVDAGMKPKIMRYVMKNMPKWVNGAIEKRILSNRPQLYFLPRDTTPTEMVPAYQPSLELERPEPKQKPNYHQQQHQQQEQPVAKEGAQAL
ncbi:hypothetical protein BGZ95_003614 [Linnemannia exigua]|uniref:FAD-binding domain-containing protein n=1 Tax=Linnemannia exigua TaxID=604196 RepID=A0AAD4D4C3_9FUNG|nr:hypothetical protein BGZ95_003614 [Linnemannia exigua]